jgi:hypothetical protein
MEMTQDRVLGLNVHLVPSSAGQAASVVTIVIVTLIAAAACAAIWSQSPERRAAALEVLDRLLRAFRK